MSYNDQIDFIANTLRDAIKYKFGSGSGAVELLDKLMVVQKAKIRELEEELSQYREVTELPEPEGQMKLPWRN